MYLDRETIPTNGQRATYTPSSSHKIKKPQITIEVQELIIAQVNCLIQFYATDQVNSYLITMSFMKHRLYSQRSRAHQTMFFVLKCITDKYIRDRPFNLNGGGGYVFFFGHHKSQNIYFFCRSKREIFFQNSTLGYMTKTLNQIIFFPPPISEYFFQQDWES